MGAYRPLRQRGWRPLEEGLGPACDTAAHFSPGALTGPEGRKATVGGRAPQAQNRTATVICPICLAYCRPRSKWEGYPWPLDVSVLWTRLTDLRHRS